MRLLNAGDQERQASLGSALISIIAAEICDLLEASGASLPVQDGTVTLTLPPRRVMTVYLQLR